MPVNPYMDIATGGSANPYMDLASPSSGNPYMDVAKQPVIPDAGVMAYPTPDGKIALIPTHDQSGKLLSDADAQEQYKRTGEHIGVFNTPEEATQAARFWQDQSAQSPTAKAASLDEAGMRQMFLGDAEKRTVPPTGVFAINPNVSARTTPEQMRAAGINIPQGGAPSSELMPIAPVNDNDSTLVRYGKAVFNAIPEEINATHAGLSGLVSAAAQHMGAKDLATGARQASLASSEATSDKGMTGKEEAVNFLAKIPLFVARMGAETAAGVPPWVGESLLAGGSKYAQAKADNATENEALGAAGISTVGNAVFFRLAGGRTSGPIPKQVAIRGLRAIGLGTLANLIDAGATAVYDPEAAKKQALSTEANLRSIAQMGVMEGFGALGEHPSVKTLPAEAASETPARTHADAIANAKSAMERGDIASARKFDLEAKSFKTLTRSAFREATPEEAARVGKYEPLSRESITPEVEQAAQAAMRPGGGAIITEPEKPMTAEQLSPEDATQLADLHQQRLDNETALDAASKSRSKAAKAEVDRLTQNQSVIENEIAKIQLGIKEPEAPAEMPPEVPTPNGEGGGLTPQGSGSALLSNEEIQRAQRGDNYYRVDRSGRVTDLGPQPDAPVRNGEAIIMVSGRTGEPQVQNSQGLGTDQAVLGRFGNKVMQVHERGRGMTGDLYTGLDIPKAMRDTAEAAKRELGLPEGATDADLGREVMNRIGRLGSSVKETVVRIMSKVRGISRDMAQALAEHFHQAVSGTRQGQLGAIGKEVKAYTPEEEAHYQTESRAMRDMISRYYPGEENAARRAELYKKIPTKSQIIADLRGEGASGPVEPQPAYERGKGLVKGLTQPIRDMGKVAKLLASGDNTASNRVFDELKNRQVIPEPYREGSGKPVELVKPAIFGEDTPTIKKDFGYDPGKHGLAKDFNHLMRSPHNIEEPVFGRSNTPTQDAQMGIVAMIHNAKNMSEYFKDLFRSNHIEDHSPEMLAEAKPLFKEFQKARAELEPLQAQQESLRSDARKAAGTPKESEAKVRLAQWESENGSKLGQAVSHLRAVSDAHEAMLKKFANQYGDARVALAAEYPKGQVPDWIKLSPEEEKAADGFRAMMDKVKSRLQEQGIPTIEGNYVTHMTRYLAEDTGMPSFPNRTPKEILGFQHREQDSSQWLPSAHAAAADYVPSVSRKMAFQHFYDKWRPMIDPSNLEGFANPASPNYAPNASKYLTQMFKTMETPEAQNYADKAINALRNYENVKLLSANIRVGWKHLAGKLTSLVAQNDVWNAPGAQAQLKAAIGKFSQEGPIRTAIEKLGINTTDWTKKAQLVDYFANTKEILGFLRENPITSGVKELDRYGATSAKTNRAFTRIFGPKAPDAIAAMRRGMQTVTSNPVAAVEAWENGLDLMTSIEKGHARGLEPAQNIKAAMSNILDFNFRGGVDAPGMVRDKSTRYLVQFAQTPMKLAELKAKLIMNGLKGGEDIYGTDHTANLIKHIVATGIAFRVAKQLGVNVADSILHLPFMNTDQWKRIANMVYYGAKMRMGSDPVARRKYLDAKAGMLGDREGAFMGSPIFDIGKDVNTLIGAGPTGLIKDMPVYNQIKAVATQKPPKGFDSVSSYLTNERTERSKRQMERQSIERGRREMRYQERRVKQK